MNQLFNRRPHFFNASHRIVRWIIWSVVTLAVLATVATLAVPPWLKSTLEKQVLAQTGRQFTVDSVSFNPLTLRVKLSGLQLLEADNRTPAFKAASLSIRISFASLFRIAPVIGAVSLTHPELHVVRSTQEGREVTNFSDIIQRMQQKPSSPEPLRFSVSNIQLQDGDLVLDDRIAAKTIHIESLNLGLPFLSTFSSAQEVFVEPALSARVNGSLVELKGSSKPFSDSQDTSVAIDIDGFHLNELTAFAPRLLPFSVKSASLTTRLKLAFHTQEKHQYISLSGTASLDDVDLTEHNGTPLYASQKIQINIADADLSGHRFAVNELTVTDPQVWVGLDQQGVLNWAGLQTGENTATRESSKPGAAAPPSEPAQLELKQLNIKNGTLHWSDAHLASPTLVLDLANIDLDVQQLSNLPKAKPAKVNFSAGKVQQLHFEGEVSPALAQVTGQFGMADFALQDYQPYFNRFLAAGVSGKLGVKSALDIKDGNVSLHALSVSLEDLSVQKSRNDRTLQGKKITVDGVTLDSAARQVSIDQITLDQVRGNVLRDLKGEINLTQLMKKSTTAPTDASSAPAATPWQTDIKQVVLTGSSVAFVDRSVQPAVQVNADAVELKLENISSKMDHPVKVALRAALNRSGQFSLNGNAGARTAQFDLELRNFSVASLQPYFTQFLNIQISSGNISSKSTLKWNAPAQINFQGGVQVANLATVDKANSADFVRWKILDISGLSVDMGGKQNAITLGKINLDDFYARAILSEAGKLNLQEVMVQAIADAKTSTGQSNVVQAAGAAAAVSAPEVKNPAVISIGEINLTNGMVNYTDNFIKPHYSMRMTGVQGRVGAMRSDLAQSAPINLNGKVNGEAPLSISGSLNPLFAPLLLDIKLTASGIDLPRLTTYSLKYAGYPIVKGELSMDVDYHIKDNQLLADNTLVIDQLTFGDRVDGPDATHLPVPFLISLLTDSEGKINLNLPISGSLNDPQFSIGALIARVFLNMVEKVVTSPFALLAHSFGQTSGADELAYIEFDPGSATLTQASKAKLDSIGAALQKRPALQLDITGRADMTADADGMRHRRLEHQIRRNINPEDQSVDSVISPAQRAGAIEQIYSAAKFTKPRNLIGIAKTLPQADMEQLILTNSVVSDDDISNLALRRESVVHVYLTDVCHVAAGRLYAIAPRLTGEGITDKGAISRVDLDLKM